MFRHLANGHDFLNCSTFHKKKHQRPSKSLQKSFSRNSVKISDCRAFSPYKTLPRCRALRHSDRVFFLRFSLSEFCFTIMRLRHHASDESKGLFTRREGYPCKGVNLASTHTFPFFVAFTGSKGYPGGRVTLSTC